MPSQLTAWGQTMMRPKLICSLVCPLFKVDRVWGGEEFLSSRKRDLRQENLGSLLDADPVFN
jgi:hypothetical protein